MVRVPTELVWADEERRPLPTVFRIVTSSDLGNLQRVLEMEEQAFSMARSQVRDLGLAMKIVGARYTFDRTKADHQLLRRRPCRRVWAASLLFRVRVRTVSGS